MKHRDPTTGVVQIQRIRANRYPNATASGRRSPPAIREFEKCRCVRRHELNPFNATHFKYSIEFPRQYPAVQMAPMQQQQEGVPTQGDAEAEQAGVLSECGIKPTK